MTAKTKKTAAAAMSAEAPRAEDLAELSRLCAELADAEAAVEAAEADLAEAKAARDALSKGRLPELMDRIGVESMRTTGGYTIEVKPSITASVPETQRAEAFRWFDENGHAGLVKRELVIPFGRDEKELAEKARKALETVDGLNGGRLGEELRVEASTLSKWVRDRLSVGDRVPDFVSVFDARVAKIKERPDPTGGL